MKKFLPLLLLFFILIPVCPAQESDFTVLITELNFKNKTNDFIKFKVLGNSDQLNLKGLSFLDDKTFKTIDQDFIVKNNQEIQLTLNSTNTDSPVELFSDHSGLTATTEQIVISKNDQVLDLACWYQEPISKTESAQFQKIQSQMQLPDLSQTCFNSKELKTGQSVFRTAAAISKDSWQMPSLPAPSASKTKTTKSAATISLPANAEPVTASKLKITEIFPNPAGTDSKKEWIEISNLGSQNLNINNYLLDDGDQGSKPFLISGQPALAPGQAAIFYSDKTKINLANSKDQVRLFSPDHQLLDQIDYVETREDLSYALMKTNDQENWQWTDQITPGKPNPTLNSISGTISVPAKIGNPNYFVIVTTDQQKFIITFTEKLIKAPLATALFVSGAKGNFTGIISPSGPAGNSRSMLLVSYQLDSTENNDSPVPTLITIGTMIAIAFFFWIRKSRRRKS